MRTLTFLFKALAVFLISVILFRCDAMMPDKCDGTTAPQISVSIKANVHIRGKNNLPMKDQRISVSFYKVPCGAAAKGEFKFEGVTDASGDFYTSEVNYNLRNREDVVMIDALGKDIVVGGISPSNLEVVTVRYFDFIEGTVKITDITLYTNQ